MTISTPVSADARARSPWSVPGPAARRPQRRFEADRDMVRRGEARPTGPRGVLLSRMSPAAQVLTALALMVILQVAALPSQDPVYDVVSFLVYAPGGIVLFPLASGLIALAACTWAKQLSELGRPWATRFAVAASASLLLLGAFPTDPPGIAEVSLSSQIHRYAALAMFIAIPAAATLTARALLPSSAGPAEHHRLLALRGAVAICLLTAAPALVAVFPAALPDDWQHLAAACDAVRGLVERVQLVTMTVIVILGASLSRPTTERAVNRAAAAPGNVIGGWVGDPMTGYSGRAAQAAAARVPAGRVSAGPASGAPAGRPIVGLGLLSRAASAATMVG